MTSSQPPTGQVDYTTFLKNMHALWAVDAELAKQIDELPDSDLLDVQPTRSGEYTVTVHTDAGRDITLHSRYNPTAEAKKFVDAISTADKYCFVVAGFGLGYHIKALFERLKGDAFIVVTERNLRLIFTALMYVDLAEVIESGKLVVLTGSNKSVLHAKLYNHTAVLMMGAQFISHPASQQVDREFYSEIRTVMTDFTAYSRMSIVTLVANSRITCRNIANNLGTYLATPPINVLHERFAGLPAIVISAGPSLRKNIDLLARAKGKCILIAVQTVFKQLLQRGIIPDFVTSLDFHELSERYFTGIDDFHGVHLIAEPKASWKIIDAYKGPISLLDNNFARMLLGDKLAARDGLTAGATVAHLSLYLAEYLGCNPIVLVGQDLAYTNHVYYTPGVEAHLSWGPELNRFCTLESKEWERIARSRSILRKVESIDGQTLYSDEQLFAYLEQFEKDIAAGDRTVIDATEGGARIAGTQVATLAQVLERYGSKRIPADRLDYRASADWFNPAAIEPGLTEMKERIEEVRTIASLCEQTIEVLGELEGLLDDPPEFNRRLARVDELRAAVRQNERAYGIINQASQFAELRRFTADRKLSAADVAGPERARRQLKRDVEFVTSMKDSADDMVTLLQEAIERMEQLLGDGGQS